MKSAILCQAALLLRDVNKSPGHKNTLNLFFRAAAAKAAETRGHAPGWLGVLTYGGGLAAREHWATH